MNTYQSGVWKTGNIYW